MATSSTNQLQLPVKTYAETTKRHDANRIPPQNNKINTNTNYKNKKNKNKETNQPALTKRTKQPNHQYSLWSKTHHQYSLWSFTYLRFALGKKLTRTTPPLPTHNSYLVLDGLNVQEMIPVQGARIGKLAKHGSTWSKATRDAGTGITVRWVLYRFENQDTMKRPIMSESHARTAMGHMTRRIREAVGAIGIRKESVPGPTPPLGTTGTHSKNWTLVVDFKETPGSTAQQNAQRFVNTHSEISLEVTTQVNPTFGKFRAEPHDTSGTHKLDLRAVLEFQRDGVMVTHQAPNQWLYGTDQTYPLIETKVNEQLGQIKLYEYTTNDKGQNGVSLWVDLKPEQQEALEAIKVATASAPRLIKQRRENKFHAEIADKVAKRISLEILMTGQTTETHTVEGGDLAGTYLIHAYHLTDQRLLGNMTCTHCTQALERQKDPNYELGRDEKVTKEREKTSHVSAMCKSAEGWAQRKLEADNAKAEKALAATMAEAEEAKQQEEEEAAAREWEDEETKAQAGNQTKGLQKGENQVNLTCLETQWLCKRQTIPNNHARKPLRSERCNGTEFMYTVPERIKPQTSAKTRQATDIHTEPCSQKLPIYLEGTHKNPRSQPPAKPFETKCANRGYETLYSPYPNQETENLKQKPSQPSKVQKTKQTTKQDEHGPNTAQKYIRKNIKVIRGGAENTQTEPEGTHHIETWLTNLDIQQGMRQNSHRTTVPYDIMQLKKALDRIRKGKRRTGDPLRNIRTRDTLIPLHIDKHWITILIDHKTKTIYIFDPLGKEQDKDLILELSTTFCIYHIKYLNIKVQTDAHSCGVWIIWLNKIWNEHISQRLQDEQYNKQIHQKIKENMEKNKIQNLHPQHTQEQLPHSKNIEFITNLREKIKLEALKHTETTASAIKNAPNNKPNKLKTAQQKMKHLFQNISKLKEVLELKENMNRRIGKNINIWRTKNKTIHNQNKKHNKTNKKTPNYSIESEQLAHLYSQNTQERYIIACTNTEGVNSEIAHLHGDLPKLEILFQQVSQNKIHVLGICGHWLQRKHAETLENLSKKYGNLKYRISSLDGKGSRGALIVWNKETFPFEVEEAFLDDNKRIVGIRMRGVKKTINIMCGYFEKVTLPKEEHTKFYNFLSRGVPKSNDPNQLYIEMGDKNCALDPPNQRFPYRSDHVEANQSLLNFIQTHNLIEPIMESHPNQQIFTRTGKNGKSKAKLDHILLNNAAYDHVVETGWIESNPLIPSDHGIIWIALDKETLAPTTKTTPTETKKNESTIRVKGAKEKTHEKYTGCPIRLIQQNTCETTHKEEHGSNIETTLYELLRLNGYHEEFFTPHKNHINELRKQVAQIEPIISDKTETLRESITRRNDKKEVWIHCAHEWVANHLIGKGKKPNEAEIGYQIKFPQTTRRINETKWNISTIGENVKQKNIRNLLHNIMKVEKTHITKINQLKDTPTKANKKTEYTNQTQKGTPTQQPPNPKESKWEITFATPNLYTIWAHYYEAWKIPTNGAGELDSEIQFKYATGWIAYEERASEYLKKENTAHIENNRVRDVIESYHSDTEGFKSPGWSANPTDDLWETCKHIWIESASKSFGHHTHQTQHKRTGLTIQLYKWTTRMKRAISKANQSGDWELTKFEQTKELRNIPIPSIQPGRYKEMNEWLHHIIQAKDQATKLYRFYRKREIKDNKRDTQRKLDGWFMHNLDKYLDTIIRIPKEHTGGLDWPKDAHGEIPLDPQARIDHHKSTWESKTATKTPVSQEVLNKKWIQEILSTPAKFTEKMNATLIKDIEMCELKATYTQNKTNAAPGPTGITNMQWKKAPQAAQSIILDMLNSIYNTGKIPQELKNGTIYPIPKDPSLPCTSDNARPLTMLESGLKMLTSILATRINEILRKDPVYNPVQFAFLPGRNIMDPLHIIENVQSNARTNNAEIHQTFLDLTQAFDRLEFWASDLAIKRMNYPQKFTNLIDNLNTDSERKIITKDGITTPWKLECGVAQGEVLSPIRFITLMDMLATWITIRSNKQNPTNKIIGYQMKHKAANQHKAKLKTTSQETIDQPPYNKLPTVITVLMYCDDLVITTDNFEDMQDLIGVISEFMNTFGIPINNKKSFYTASMPKSQQHDIVTAPTTEGHWEGGIAGKWIANRSPTTNITIRQQHESIRYLGVHFSLNGSWKTQKEILETTLTTSLARLRQKDLPPEQLAYLINTIILPKLIYPLNIISILTQDLAADITVKLDNIIAKFAILYLGYPPGINHKFLYTSQTKKGIGLDSIQDLVGINTITNTTITLNDWNDTQYWSKQIQKSPKTDNTTIDNVAKHYLMVSNLYPRILLESLNQVSTQHSFYLKGHLKGNNNKDDIANNLARQFTKLGYSIERANQIEEAEDSHTWLIRVLTRKTYNKLSNECMKHNLWKMGDFTLPCGTHLDTWESYNTWERSVGIRTRKKPEWFQALEEETLQNPYANSTDRTLKLNYWDSPKGILLNRPFCMAEGDNLKLAMPSTYTQLDPNTTDLSVLMYDTKLIQNQWKVENPRLRNIQMDTNQVASQYTTKQNDALVSMEGIIDKLDDNTTITTTTYEALLQQCEKQSKNRTTKECAEQESDGGSMNSDSETAEENNTMTPIKKKQTEEPDYHTCSDGSVYHFTKGINAAGYAVAQIKDETRDIYRRNIPCHQTWSAPDAILNYNPESTQSTDAELEGLSAAIDQYFPPYDENAATHEVKHKHVLDNDGVLKTTSKPERSTKIRHAMREHNHYKLDKIRNQLTERKHYKSESNSQFEISWIKGHSGDRLHECSDRHAARIAFRHTETEPNRNPTYINYPFVLYFYQCLIEGDVRKHVKEVSKQIWLKKWEQLPSQGWVAKYTSKLTKKLPDYKNKGTPTNISKFFAKLINSVSYTPHHAHKIQKIQTPQCPICQDVDATIEHILFECPSAKLKQHKEKLDETLTNIIVNKTHFYDQPHLETKHPIEAIPMSKLYPYASQIHNENHRCVIEALPESRWYRKSKSHTGMVTIQEPSMNQNTPHSDSQHTENATSNHENTQVQIPLNSFWTLIAWHKLTHSDKPLTLPEYDKRATHIWEAVTQAKASSGASSLCWAADRLLLDILIDECGCERELFSNILNTYHRFKNRRMLKVHHAFERHGGLQLDGLADEAYVGAVYGNPPFDGNLTNCDTINTTLDKAAMAANHTNGFRAVFFLPLTDAKINERCRHPQAKLIMKFPNNSVSFIPDGHWYGGNKHAGCYNEKNTHMILIMYESTNIRNLRPIDQHTLESKLAAWYLHTTPKRNHTRENIKYTGIPFKHFHAILTKTMSTEWKFWERTHNHNTTSENSREQYIGSAHDSTFLNKSPIKDIIQWDRKIAHMGYMPDTFKDFLNIMGIPKAKTTQTENNICTIMRKHTYQMFKTYWRQCQLLNEKGELILLSTENSHSTQQTELEAIEEEMSENDTPSENDSNTDEEAEEEYWQKAGKNQGSDDEETCVFATVAIPLP